MSMLKIKIFLIANLLFSCFFWAQTLVHGTIILDDLENEDFAIEITNLTHKQSITTTNLVFQLFMNVNDRLKIVSAFTEEREIFVTEEIIKNKKIEIHLNKYIVRLKDTNVLNLTGYLHEDERNVKSDPFEGLKGQMMYRMTDFEVMNLKKESIIEPINGEIETPVNLFAIGAFIVSKLIKPKEKPIIQQKSIEEIIEYLGKDYFNNDLNILPINAENFLAFVSAKHPTFLQMNYLDIIKILTEESRNYHSNIN